MRLLALVSLALLTATAVSASEIRLLTAGAFKQVPAALVARFQKETGHTVTIENDTAGGLMRKVKDGAPFDLLVLTPGGIDELIKDGKIVGGSRQDLARVGIGVAVKAGAPHPDISSTADFKKALMDAKSVAYIDPHAGGSSGVYFDNLLLTLGIAEPVRAKAVLVPGGLVAEKLVTGEATLAIHQISEILAVKGAELVGPLPPDIQNYTFYSAGIGAAAKEPEPARQFLNYLAGPDGAAILKEKGMLPVR